MSLSFAHCHPSWHQDIQTAIAQMDPSYVAKLDNENWLPGPEQALNAFSIAKPAVKTILLGESPYPRAESANGYAFWDAAVGSLWSDSGLDKRVNRATSLRNFIKMLLFADGLLTDDNMSQPAISRIDKSQLISTNKELFNALLNHGFLLLNASLVFRAGLVREDAKAWRPFIGSILQSLSSQSCRLLLFGRIAAEVDKLNIAHNFDVIRAEHPYNLSFIHNQAVINCFKPLTLLQKTSRI